MLSVGAAAVAVGEVVASCDFDSATSDIGLVTGCWGVYFSELGHFIFSVASTSYTSDTGPSADHTGEGGRCHNGSGCLE